MRKKLYEFNEWLNEEEELNIQNILFYYFLVPLAGIYIIIDLILRLAG